MDLLFEKKSDVFHASINFKTQLELQLNYKIKTFQSDWGGEFQGLTSFFTTHGIMHHNSCPYAY